MPRFISRLSLLVCLAAILLAPTSLFAQNPKLGTISGQIVLEDGSPSKVEGWMYYNSQREGSATSGNAGRFDHKFSFSPTSGTVWLSHFAKGYAPAWVGPIELAAGETIKDINIVLNKGFSQHLKITDVEGTPIPGVTIVAHPEINGSAGGPVYKKKANEKGEYLFEHMADTRYEFYLKAPGFQPLTSDPIELEPNEVLPVHMLRAKFCTGTIVNADGTPAAGAKMRAHYEERLDGSGAGYSQSGQGIWGELWATTNDQGQFELNELRDGSQYLFIIETADKARVVVHDLQANQQNRRLQIPQRRDLVVTVNGDVSLLTARRGKPFVAVRQRINFQKSNGGIYGDLIGEDFALQPTAAGGKVIFRGLAVDLNSNIKEQEIEVSLGYSSKWKQTVQINPTGPTLVTFELPDQKSSSE